MAMQAQIQALLVEGAVARGEGVANIEVAKSQIFDRTLTKVSEFVTVCKLYLRMKMREAAVEEQIQ